MRTSLERYLPVAYLLLSILLIAALLPTALRPPQPPPPTSAEFSPDAPPDEDHEVILSELSRGTTTTAGTAEEVEVGAGPGAVPEPMIELAPRRGLCFGDPPRQAESIYSPPCAAAWSGDNGGDTWQGVTPTEVRIAVIGDEDDVGRVPTERQDGESSDLRTLRVWQAYFNERFELYNRRLQLYVISIHRRDGDGSGSDAASGAPADSQRAAVTQADEEFEVFGLVNTEATAISAEDEAVRRELVYMGRGSQPHAHFRDNAPFVWSFSADADMMRKLAAEIVCKQMGDNPPEFNNEQDPNFDYSASRVYGIIAYQDHVHHGAIDMWKQELGRCGLSFAAEQTMNLGDQAEHMAGAVTRMRSEGVTTIVLATDGVSPAVFTNEAQNSNYYPEWVHQGTGGQDLNGAAGLHQQSQWQHAIGITSNELPSGRTSGSDGFRAYQEIDPNGTPARSNDFFLQLMQMVGGIQLAGPELTPHAFQNGMHRAWPPRPPEPSWTIGGGYRPGKWTFPEYVALQWWDRNAPRPGSGQTGAYRHPFNGKRFKLGEIPTDPIPFFEHGDPSHITEAPEDERM